MGGYSKSDLLQFNEGQLSEMIGIMEEIHDKMVASKNSYDDYVANQLSPVWTTDNGKKSVSDLQSFSEQDIQGFINYINSRISDLNSALENVKNINIA